jgi:hypothetical protein
VPIVRILLVLLALASPALAQDGAHHAAGAQEAAQAFRVYVEGVTKAGRRPDPTQPEVAVLLGHVFDVGALNALPPAQGGDMDWLLEWMHAVKETNKLLLLHGAKLAPQPDFAAIQRNAMEFQDQYAAALSFMIRLQARQAVTGKMFMAGLAPKERTAVREKAYVGFRNFSANMIVENVCAVILGGAKPANVHLVTAAIRDTREVWASALLPQDRARVIEQLTGVATRASDEAARTDIAAFTAAVQAAN